MIVFFQKKMVMWVKKFFLFIFFGLEFDLKVCCKFSSDKKEEESKTEKIWKWEEEEKKEELAIKSIDVHKWGSQDNSNQIELNSKKRKTRRRKEGRKERRKRKELV